MLSLAYMPERKTPFRWPYGIGNVLTLFPSSKQFGLPRPPRGSPPPLFFNKQKAPISGELARSAWEVAASSCEKKNANAKPHCQNLSDSAYRWATSPFRGGSPGANPPPIHQKTTLKFVENNPYFFLRRGLWCGMIRKTEKVWPPAGRRMPLPGAKRL